MLPQIQLAGSPPSFKLFYHEFVPMEQSGLLVVVIISPIQPFGGNFISANDIDASIVLAEQIVRTYQARYRFCILGAILGPCIYAFAEMPGGY